jgi:hypothetical protein
VDATEGFFTGMDPARTPGPHVEIGTGLALTPAVAWVF